MEESCCDDVCVVIPKYLDSLTENEEISLRQCSIVLRNYRKVFISPTGLDNEEFMEQYGVDDTLYFDGSFFEGTDSYSRLMLSGFFYERFRDFSHILIHQLDAFVFKDELQFWCEQGYDYIGAPWLVSKWPYKPELDEYLTMWKNGYWPRRLRKILYPKRKVGNGGFSLRKVSTFCGALKKLQGMADGFPFAEDLFWSIVVPSHLPSKFKKPFAKTAALFSVEANPRLARKISKNKFPFGCHAWETHDTDYWRELFAEVGVKI